MPFCPNCGCEYRPGYDACPDCEVGLVEQDPNPPKAAAPRFVPGWPTLELVLVALAIPWTMAFLDGNGLLVLFAVAFIYGWWRPGVSYAHCLAGWAIGVVLQAVISITLVSAGVYPDKLLIGGTPIFALLSGVALLLAAAGSALRPGR